MSWQMLPHPESFVGYRYKSDKIIHKILRLTCDLKIWIQGLERGIFFLTDENEGS